MRVIHVPAEYRPMIEDSADFERSEMAEQQFQDEQTFLASILRIETECAEYVRKLRSKK